MILVVDDEPALRMLAKAILEHGGYQVLVAAIGREAVEVPVMGGEEALT
jgi:CheY-like chemotaxis protein